MKDNKVVVSFEKVNGSRIKGTTKVRRKNTSGRIEREEIWRAMNIETDVFLNNLVQKNNWYPMD